MLQVNWDEILIPAGSLPELVLRGSIMFLALFLALRFFQKRNTGEIGVADLLVIVLISEVAQNAIVGEAKSATEAVLSVGVILFWSWALNWLSFHVPAFKALTAGKPVVLVKDGQANRANMRRELMTTDELMGQLRLQGVDDIADVKLAQLEGDGRFSMVRRDDGDARGAPDRAMS